MKYYNLILVLSILLIISVQLISCVDFLKNFGLGLEETSITTESHTSCPYNPIYVPTTKSELKSIMADLINSRGNEADFNDICTKNITDMSNLFENQQLFNGNISFWDVRNVTDMEDMFRDAHAFNKDLGEWEVHSALDMRDMFIDSPLENNPPIWYQATNLVCDYTPTNRTDLANAIAAEILTQGNNANLNNICTKNITDMSMLFQSNTSFNGDVSLWDTSNVTNMNSMFNGASSFNGDISRWDTYNVTDMDAVFMDATVFNSDLSEWNVSGATGMSEMFSGASKFNQDISGWDISNVIDMEDMFSGASAFDKNLEAWTPQWVAITAGLVFNGSGVIHGGSNDPLWCPASCW